MRPAPRPTLELVAWNCWVGNSNTQVLATLRAWADTYRPDVFVLSEARTHAAVLDRVPGYRVLQERPARKHAKGRVSEHGDCAILIAEHVQLRTNWVARMARTWVVFSHRRVHDPRRYQVAGITVRGQLWRIRASHPPTGGFDGGNAVAFMESMRRSRRWLRRRLVPSVDAGDMNEQRARLAAWFGPRFRVYGAGIDLAVTRGVLDCEYVELGKGGSDAHHGHAYRFTA